MVELALPTVTPDDVAAAKLVVADVQAAKKPAPKFLDQVQAFKALDVAARLGKPLSVEVQVISLGDDLAWVGLPGEIFVDLGLQVKQGSPFRQTMIAELANGSIGYVPNRVAYPQGNYEVVSARCAEGSGEKLRGRGAEAVAVAIQEEGLTTEAQRRQERVFQNNLLLSSLCLCASVVNLLPHQAGRGFSA